MIAFGVGMALILCVSLLPAMVMLLPFKVDKSKDTRPTFMHWLAQFTVRFHKAILVVFTAVLVLLVSVGVPKNQINEMFTRYLDNSFEFRQANDFINQNITGIHRLFYTLGACPKTHA